MAYTATGRQAGYGGGIDVEVRGLPQVQAMLAKFDEKQAKKALQQATNAAGKVVKPRVRDAVPSHMKRLRKAVSSKQAARARPATVVSARPKVAFYRHWIERGTKAHNIRFPNEKKAGVDKRSGSIRHPGVTHTVDYIGIGFTRGQADAMAAFSKVIDDYLKAI